MKHATKNDPIRVISLFLIGCTVLAAGGCATAPKWKDRPEFLADAQSATAWFEKNVSGLHEQIEESAGYIIFPSVTQWGMGYTGGKWGRGMANNPNGSQIGWAKISTPSLGLQGGVQGFKMLIVLENRAALKNFKQNSFSGSASATAVAIKSGGSTKASFENGVAVYQGANAGLMAGANVGLDVLRFEPLRN